MSAAENPAVNIHLQVLFRRQSKIYRGIEEIEQERRNRGDRTGGEE